MADVFRAALLIPQEQGLRQETVEDKAENDNNGPPYSSRTRIKTLIGDNLGGLFLYGPPYSSRTRIKTCKR